MIESTDINIHIDLESFGKIKIYATVLVAGIGIGMFVYKFGSDFLGKKRNTSKVVVKTNHK